MAVEIQPSHARGLATSANTPVTIMTLFRHTEIPMAFQRSFPLCLMLIR